MRIEPAHHAGAGRIADRDVAVGLPKRNTALDEPFDVRRLCLRVPTEGFDIVIEVIADYEQDVWLFRLHGNMQQAMAKADDNYY